MIDFDFERRWACRMISLKRRKKVQEPPLPVFSSLKEFAAMSLGMLLCKIFFSCFSFSFSLPSSASLEEYQEGQNLLVGRSVQPVYGFNASFCQM